MTIAPSTGHEHVRGGAAPIAPAVPTSSALHPLGIDEVKITGGFWRDRQELNATATLPHIRHWLEREGWLPNFDLASAGTLPDGRRGREFSDSEVYKYLEAAAWEIGRTNNAALEEDFRAVVARVAAAQDRDGYLNTNFGRVGQQPRWSDLEWGHELYCAGHLFQAAVARARTRPDSDDGLVDIATRYADLICTVFGPKGIASVCGHAEVETALVELGRVTRETLYSEQARLFIERRGHNVLADIEWGRAYYQDDIPIREADVLRGHAVRANYLAAGAADVAAEFGDADLDASLVRQWANATAKRTYITGGQGSHHQDEAFGDDYELPPDRAYSETCAGIASIQFSWRMLLAHDRAEYADLIERTLFNVVATSVSRDGTSFYYANTLHRRTPGSPADPDLASPRAEASLRAPWFSVSCCPPNVARTLASLAGYIATSDETGIQLHQFAPARITTSFRGQPLELTIETGYPTAGRVRIIVHVAPKEWSLRVRVPGWATSATLHATIDGKTLHHDAMGGAYTSAPDNLRPGDVVELELDIAARFVTPDPRIDAVRGSVAIQRGPVVYALESVDLPEDGDVGGVVVDTNRAPHDADGIVSVRTVNRVVALSAWPYSVDDRTRTGESHETALVPYYDWAERGPSTMRVWIPESSRP